MVDYLVSVGWSKDLATIVAIVLGVIVCASFGLVWVSIAGIWLERKFAARVQDRLGPNRVGPWGLFQMFADLGKLLTKEDITPQGADRTAYNVAPLMAVGAVLLIWAVIPFSAQLIGADLNVGVLYFTAVGSFATLAILLAGWSSNNKYALLGAFRVVAQLISYEIPMVLSLLVPVLLAGTMSMQGIVGAQSIAYVFVVPGTALLFFISSLAEVGRTPFDLLEAESEIIAGYNTEYSGMKFGMFYAGEFMHAFTICALTAVLFLGGWRGPGAEREGLLGAALGFLYFMIKTVGVYLFSLLVRNTIPRLRIDHLMAFNWKFLVPLSLVNVLVIALLAKVFTPDYAAAQQIVANGGILGLIGGVLGAGFLAEFPRALALLIANIAIFVGVARVLRLYVHLNERKVRDLISPAYTKPGVVPSDGTTAAAPAAGR